MEIIVPFIVLLLCTCGLAVGFIFSNKPFQKRCSLEPDKNCDCPDDVACKKNRPDLFSEEH